MLNRQNEWLIKKLHSIGKHIEEKNIKNSN